MSRFRFPTPTVAGDERRTTLNTFAKSCLLAFLACMFHHPPILANPADFAAIVTDAKHGTVGILKQAASPSRVSVRGSGLYLGDGYILTARHVAGRRDAARQEGGNETDPLRISIVSDALEEAPAALVGVNHFLDIALYRIPHEAIPPGLSARRFAETEALPGERVFTVGYPLGWGPAVSYGAVGNPDTFLETIDSRLVQVDLSACSGNSGGGLFNAHGEIVGVIHAIIQTDAPMGERRCSRFAFAVPGPLAHKIVAALKQGTPFHFSTLGLRLTSVKIGQQWQVAVANATGPSRRAGLQPGDVLLSIDKRRVDSAGQLKNYLIEQTHPLQPVDIHILRDGQEHVIRVMLGKARDG